MKTILPCFLLATGTLAATAASRGSASYSVPADAVDAGGRATTSASYANIGCVGGFGGLGAVAVPAETAKHGYIGQLYDVSMLTLAANPATVNEGATRQIAVSAMLDDATKLNVSAFSVAWSVLNGPINSINASGLAQAGNVYQNTSATVQGLFGGKTTALGLTVLNVGNDDFGTYAGDGMDDDWQVQYFGLNNPGGGPNADPDGDHQDNRYEFTVGTHPLDGNSFFRFRIEPVPARPFFKNLIFSPRLPDRTYTILYSIDLGTPGFNKLSDFEVSDAGPERTVVDLHATEANKFYRVYIEK